MLNLYLNVTVIFSKANYLTVQKHFCIQAYTEKKQASNFVVAWHAIAFV